LGMHAGLLKIFSAMQSPGYQHCEERSCASNCIESVFGVAVVTI
jgi:hypothetical protein